MPKTDGGRAGLQCILRSDPALTRVYSYYYSTLCGCFPPTPQTRTATTFTVGSVVRRCGWWGCGCGCGCGVILHLLLERLNRHGDKKIVLPGTFER